MKKYIAVPAALAALGVAAAPAAARVQPLGLQQAKQAARNAGWNFPTPGGTDGVKVTWSSRWSAWRIDFGVEADGRKTSRTWDSCKTISDYTYDCLGGWDYSTDDTWAMGTVSVFKSSRTGRISTRTGNDISTFGG
jgi:hypothetical protein